MREKKGRRWIALCMVLTMLLSLLTISPELSITAQAATKKYVKSLNVKNSVKVAVGSKVVVSPKVQATKKTNTKLKVKVKNKKVARATYSVKTKKITIYGKKVGNTTVTVSTVAKNKKGKVISKKIKVAVTQKKQNTSETTEVTTEATTEGSTQESTEKKETITTVDENKDNPNVVTRMEWIESLLDTVQITESTQIQNDSLQNIFSDVTDDSELYILDLAVKNNILEYSEGDSFYPDQATTREFAAVTAIKACGFQITDNENDLECSDVADLCYAKYDNVAVRNKMFSLSGQKFEPQRALNQNEKTVCLSVVKEQWNQLNAPITEKDAVEFQDNVIYDELQNITDYSMEMEPDGTYNISISDASNSVSFSENKIILLPGNNENPDGIACKIEAFEERDGIMYIWGRPVTELGDVFENLSLSGTISNLENPVLAEGASFVKETDSDDNSESFDLKYAPEILNVSSSNENAWKIKKSVDVLHPETLTTTQTEVTFTINQPSIDFDFEIRNKKIQELSISMNNEASADISLEGTVTSQIPLIESVEVPLKYGFKLDMALYVIFEAEGKLSYKPVLNSVHKVRLSMDNPTSPQFSKDVSFNDDFELEASLKFGIQPEIMLEWCSCWDIADINAEIGIEFKAKYKHYNHCDSENNNRFRCIDISAQRMFNINFLEKETVVKALIVEFMEKEDFEGFTVKIPDKNKITNHLECKNDEPWEEVVKCTRDEQAYDALGNKIIAASIIFEEYYLEPDSENNLQLNEVTVASYPYSWTPGCKVSVPELNSLLSYDNTFIKCKVTVTTENGVYELSYDALYEEGDNLYYNEFSLEGIDLTTALWLFMGYQCDTDMNENQL